jgi:molybdate transport system substrate-binding protein
MQEAVKIYQMKHPGPIHLNYAGSNTLRVQIEKGSPADIFISADAINVDLLVSEGLTVPGTAQVFTGNALVVISPLDKPMKMTRLADLPYAAHGFLVIADPETAPAGVYARQALKNSGAWLNIEPRLVKAVDVRAALAQVETGAVVAGMVYKTDAERSRRVAVALKVPESLHDPIRYKSCMVKRPEVKPEAEAFYEFLQSPAMQEILGRHGFVAP